MKRRRFNKSVLFLPALLIAIWMTFPIAWPSEAAAATDKVHLKMGGSNTGTLVYMVAAVLSDLWKANIPGLDITLMATPGSTANHPPIDRGEMDIAVSANSADWWAHNGMHFTKTKLTNFCSLFPITKAFQHAATYVDSPIKTWKDMDGKRVQLVARASPSSITFEEIFNVLNIKVNGVFSTPSEAIDMVKDKRVDAIVYGVGAPWSGFMDVARDTPIRFIPMPAADQERICKAVPHLSPAVLPAKTYSFQNEDCPMPAAYPDIIVRPGLPEDLVYKLTKVAWEHWNDVVKGVSATKWVSPKDVVNMVAPIHPGAVKYYRELGINIPDRLIWKQ
jgi:TRAP transporter TAXI family solute receptor